jgi:SAM-dependent methyltransferase
MRPGAYYRTLVAAALGKNFPSPWRERARVRVGVGISVHAGWTLDLGSGDGQLLQTLGPRAVGLDLKSATVRGDGTAVPFATGAFQTVVLLDVLEHVQDDEALMKEALRVCAPNGTLWLSVPARSMRLFPPFLTAPMHRAWGHVRPGYTREQLRRLLPEGAEIVEWDEPAYRALYFPIVLLSKLAPPVARWVIRLAFGWDSARRAGDHGHYFCRIQIPGS